MLNRVMSLHGTSLHHCACGQHSSFWRNVVTMASSWKQSVHFDRPRDLNLRPPAPETNVLPLDNRAPFVNPYFPIYDRALLNDPMCYKTYVGTKSWSKYVGLML